MYSQPHTHTHLQAHIQTVLFWCHGVIINKEKIFTLDLSDYQGWSFVYVCMSSVVLEAEYLT